MAGTVFGGAASWMPHKCVGPVAALVVLERVVAAMANEICLRND